MINIEVKNGTYTYNGEEFSFDYYTDTGIVNKIDFVNSVVSSIVDKDSYCSIARDLIFDYMIVKKFTDIDMLEIEMSDDKLSKLEDFLYKTNVANLVKNDLIEGLVDELNTAVDNDIEYRTGVHRNSLTEAVADLLRMVEKKMSDIDTKGLMEMAEKMNKVSGEFTPSKVLDAYAESDIFKKQYEDILYEQERKRNLKVLDSKVRKELQKSKK